MQGKAFGVKRSIVEKAIRISYDREIVERAKKGIIKEKMKSVGWNLHMFNKL